MTFRSRMLLALFFATPTLAGMSELQVAGEAAEARLERCPEASLDCQVDPSIGEDLFTVIVHRWVTMGAVDTESVSTLQLLDPTQYGELPKHLQRGSRPAAWATVVPVPKAGVAAPTPASVVPEAEIEAVAVEPMDEPEPEPEPEPEVVDAAPLSALPLIDIRDLEVRRRTVPAKNMATFRLGNSSCRVLLTVDERGRITGVAPSLCGAFDFAPTAEAVKKWRLKPYIERGEAVSFQTLLTVKYRWAGTEDETSPGLARIIVAYEWLEPNPERCGIAAELYNHSGATTPATMATTDLTQCFAAVAGQPVAWPEVDELTECSLVVRANTNELGAKVVDATACPDNVRKSAEQAVKRWAWAEPTYGDRQYDVTLRFHPGVKPESGEG